MIERILHLEKIQQSQGSLGADIGSGNAFLFFHQIIGFKPFPANIHGMARTLDLEPHLIIAQIYQRFYFLPVTA